jgi:hypothetical protein
MKQYTVKFYFLKGKSNSKSTAYIPMPKGRGFTPLFGKQTAA